ncbi:hypothetical protein CDAR_310641 [Caerostris darwini]|uniref:Uncharacterized protein n=1 Tax=Caerostris darwini TaxID=1538125 RepID=A0AAV4VM77_9ARAC|nr:hypothetical protein CDAR_310641 [Caerostris darwini]
MPITGTSRWSGKSVARQSKIQSIKIQRFHKSGGSLLWPPIMPYRLWPYRNDTPSLHSRHQNSKCSTVHRFQYFYSTVLKSYYFRSEISVGLRV